jgi:hypothetical protein
MKLYRTRIGVISFVVCLAFLGAFAAASPADHHGSKNADEQRKPITLNVYALDTCPVSGMKLGSMGDTAVKEY